MNIKFFSLSINNYIADLRLNKPEKSNAIDAEGWIEMKQVFQELSADPKVRVVVLSGEGPNFCSGIDLSLLMDISKFDGISCDALKREKVRESIIHLQSCISSIENCRKPVLAAIHRACIGGGVDLISACDMRYCSEDAYFTIKEVDMGLVADIGTMQRLPKIIASGIMAELAYTGRKVFSEEAKEIALVNKVYKDKDSMILGVMEIAGLIASKSPLVVRGTKENLLYSRDHSVSEGLKYISTYNAAYLISEDLMEAFRAQMTKTIPQFKD